MSAVVHLEVFDPTGVAQGTVAARHVKTFGSAAELARATLAQRRDLPAGFESFTCVQMNEFYLSHRVEMSLDYAATLQREAGLIQRENAVIGAATNSDNEGAGTAVDADDSAGKHASSLAANPATRPPVVRPHPAHYQAHGRLYRAIVSLPASMCERDRPLQERWVFFDCPTDDMPHGRIEALLALAWNISTLGWCDNGLIYNITEARELIAQNDADDDTALFECEWGSEGTKHVPLHDVDFFCTPRVRARLELALLQAHLGTSLEGGAA